MPKFNFLLLTLACTVLFNACKTKKQEVKDNDTSTFTSPYLGQKPPGLTPELFAPGIVSTNDLEIEAAFSPDMEEFYFLRQRKGEKPKNYVIKYENGVWNGPVEVQTSSGGELFISLDDETMHLGNTYRERTVSGWSQEKSLGPLFEEFPIMRLTASATSTYVFDERDTIGTLRYSRLIDGKRETPRSFPDEINTGTFTAHPFIASDESYLIWDSNREGGYGDSDLYISYRQADGSWGAAINMGEGINTEHEDIYGSVTPDGKYFFFQTIDLGKSFEESKANIYWVSAEIIHHLKPIDVKRQ